MSAGTIPPAHFGYLQTGVDGETTLRANREAFDDLYLASTFGLDAMVGYKAGFITPYAAIGFTDVSTFFYIGDDGVVTNNMHPYAGLTFSTGASLSLNSKLKTVAEFYGAPGGYSMPDPSLSSVKPASRYGHIYTARFRFSWAL